MTSLKNILKLLAIPCLWMGFVQVIFGLLSLEPFNDHVHLEFLVPGTVMMLLAWLLFTLHSQFQMNRISYRDAMIFATLTWVICGLLGAAPIMLVTDVSYTDAAFESISALTTTGATILTGLDDMPKSFLLYRQFLQWMGGLGVVIFVVAVLPMLNVGGMKLLKAETPGPVKDDKLSPRISNAAHYLWFVYLMLTVSCAAAYALAGMSIYDAIAHSFTTVSTGGFSTHDASMWFFESHTILAVSNVFMLLGAINFALHFRTFRGRTLRLYWKDEESRTFLLIVVGLATALALYLYQQSNYPTLAASVSFALFHVISFITSTGYGAADLSSWPLATSVFLVVTAYLGGCAGSTAGGNKIIRNIITFKVIRREFHQLVHPKGVFLVKFQNQPVDNSVRSAVMAFMALSATSSMLLTLVMMATGLDFWSAFTAVAACINVLGPGFGEVGSNFQSVSDTGSWVLFGAMILGRLEYFTALALFFPGFWSR